jgi:hypothetical protein
MALESGQKEMEADPAVDIWALGVIACVCFSLCHSIASFVLGLRSKRGCILVNSY